MLPGYNIHPQHNFHISPFLLLCHQCQGPNLHFTPLLPPPSHAISYSHCGYALPTLISTCVLVICALLLILLLRTFWYFLVLRVHCIIIIVTVTQGGWWAVWPHVWWHCATCTHVYAWCSGGSSCSSSSSIRWPSSLASHSWQSPYQLGRGVTAPPWPISASHPHPRAASPT